MLLQPVLLSRAAAIVATAFPSITEEYVLGHARRFVSQGFIQPTKTIGAGQNRRAFLDSYGVARLAVLSFIVHQGLDLNDLAETAQLMTRGFRRAVDEIAAKGNSDETQWYFHNHIDLIGKHWGSCSKESEAGEIVSRIALFSTRVALTPILSQLIDVMRESDA